jgi:catechol 2,3-dioxygenase-like lactoylglutathione lyase family enzyme
MKTRLFDHIDLRVRNFDSAKTFYGKILPELGFICDRSDSEWGTFYSAGLHRPAAFFGFTEDPKHVPNGTRIAFWAETREEVDRFEAIVRQAGGKNLEGPAIYPEYSPGYYAFFFEDPDGNKLEICCREQPIVTGS